MLWKLYEMILPMLLLIGVGYLLRLLKLWDSSTAERILQMVGSFLLPTVIFLRVYRYGCFIKNFSSVDFYLLGIIAVPFLFFAVLVPAMEKNNRVGGVVVENIFFGDYAMFGTRAAALLGGIFGMETCSMRWQNSITLILPLGYLLSVFILEIHRYGKEGLGKVLFRILTHPVFIALAAGEVMRFFSIQLPSFALEGLTIVENAALGMLLLAIGGIFRFKATVSGRGAVWSLVGRSLLLPLFGVGIALLMGFRGEGLLLILIATTAASCPFGAALVRHAESDTALSVGQICGTAVLSPLVTFGLVSAMQYFHWL